mgnify:CR=1 FL=1
MVDEPAEELAAPPGAVASAMLQLGDVPDTDFAKLAAFESEPPSSRQRSPYSSSTRRRNPRAGTRLEALGVRTAVIDGHGGRQQRLSGAEVERRRLRAAFARSERGARPPWRRGQYTLDEERQVRVRERRRVYRICECSK